MNDDLEHRLRAGLSLDGLPAAPEELRAYVAHLSELEPAARRHRSVTLAVMVGLALVAATLFAIVVGGGAPVPIETPTPSPSGAPASPTPSMPAAVDGLTVLTVSEVLEARAAGGLVDQPAAVKGYWSYRAFGHSCNAPLAGESGELMLPCHDGEWGITEWFEAIGELLPDSRWVPASGPHLTPWVSDALMAQLIGSGDAPAVLTPPVPIVVVGHFDDPRAADCPQDLRQQCLDRLVLDRIVSFDPEAAPAVTPSPSPTPFPNPPPADLFTTEMCYDGVSKAFIGWTTADQLDAGFEREGHLFAMVTQDVIAIGGWFDSPQYKGHQARWWGKGVCIAQSAGTIEYSAVTGSTFLELDDGRHIEGAAP